MDERTRQKAIDANTRASQWLYRANVCEDRAKAEKLYDKAQFWLDRMNKLEGRA